MRAVLVDFECEYDGERIFLKAGRDRLSDDHELCRRYPERFGPDAHRARGRLATRQTPPAGAGKTRATVELSPYARRALLNLIADFDGDECGGGLFGHRAADGSIVIDDVGNQASSAQRTSLSTEIPIGHCLALEESLRALGSDSIWIGDWHVHDRGSGRPSDIDERAWKSLAAVGGYWVGVIATPRDEDEEWRWLSPTLHTWVVRAGSEPLARRAGTLESATLV